MTKQELRKHIRMLKKQYLTGGLSPCEVNLTWGQTPCEVVMLYSALPDEVPTQKLFDEFLAQVSTNCPAEHLPKFPTVSATAVQWPPRC